MNNQMTLNEIEKPCCKSSCSCCVYFAEKIKEIERDIRVHEFKNIAKNLKAYSNGWKKAMDEIDKMIEEIT